MPSPSVNRTADSLKRQGLTLTTAYCQNGSTAAFMDNYWMSLYGGIQLVGKVHATHDVLFPVDARSNAVIDEAALLKAVKTNRQLAQCLDAEHEYLPVLGACMMSLPGSRIVGTDVMVLDHVTLAEDMNDWADGLREDADRTQIKVESLAWQRAADDGLATLESYVASVAEGAASFTVMQICLLDCTYAPANKAEAFQIYDASIQLANRYQRLLAGHLLNGDPPPLARPDVATVLARRNNICSKLRTADFDSAELLGHVVFAKFSRINGPYMTALLFFNGDCENVWDKLADRVGEIWRDVTAGAGFHYVWPQSHCPWIGRITSPADAKFSRLMLELESVMLAERYVRPKAFSGVPTVLVGCAAPTAGRGGA